MSIDFEIEMCAYICIICIYVYVCMYIYIYIYIYVYIYIYIDMTPDAQSLDTNTNMHTNMCIEQKDTYTHPLQSISMTTDVPACSVVKSRGEPAHSSAKMC